jgi:serine/threonine protein phosphatase PrpC
MSFFKSLFGSKKTEERQIEPSAEPQVLPLIEPSSKSQILPTTECYNYSCQGDSHKATNKECQDYSRTYVDKEKGIYIAVVCDGHGGDTYFRSAVGAKAAADITITNVLELIREDGKNLFANMPFTQVGILDTIAEQDNLDISMRRLFAKIYIQWRNAILEDAKRPITQWEIENVKPEHLQILQDSERIVKAYGCTLMTYAQTPDYWFAFHLGDGKCVMMDKDMQFSQPIPWDERCFLNKTTSLCDSEPVEEFRYCAEGDGQFPAAIFLGSDGLDDSLGDGDKLYNFYGNIIRRIKQEGLESVIKEIQENLPILSAMRSKDDMSVAFVYDESQLDAMSNAVECRLKEALSKDLESLKSSMEEWEQKLADINRRIEKATKEVKDLESRKPAIEREYQRVKADYEKTLKSLQNIVGEKVETDS